jgi:hypothetical protein
MKALQHEGVAISLFSMRHEIASVVLLPRKDMTTQSPPKRGKGGYQSDEGSGFGS